MKQLWRDTLRSARELRRELHAHPELTWQEEKTGERIRRVLTDLAIPWRSCATHGVVARLGPPSGAADGPHIALRADMDALPLDEKTGKPWASRTSGCMHACGHDGHTATLLAVARWLKDQQQMLTGPVSLLFQPAEEGGHGAWKMIEDGALQGVDEIYGWHNWPAIPFGKLACPDGLVMSGNGTFQITLTGRGGHASQPEACQDPVLAASAVTMALQQVVSRRISPQRAAVVSVTSIEAPSSPTVIPDQAVISGSIRVPDEETRQLINRLLEEVSVHTAQGYGVAPRVEVFPRYQSTINHPRQAEKARTIWRQAYGPGSLEHQLSLPIMASEDFSYYLQERPGAFALIGADDGDGHDRPCHSAYYDFNDRLIPLVVRFYARLVGAEVPPMAEDEE